MGCSDRNLVFGLLELLGVHFLSQSIGAKAIGQLLSDHASSLELYASQWTSIPEDCVQEAFIELATQSTKPDSPIAWLFRVVRNKSLNASRSARRRANHERLAAALSSPLVFEKQWSDERESLAAALSNLSSDDRELIVLRVWSGLTWQQVAELTRTSSSSAQRNYVVALKKLREILEPSCQKNLKFRPT